MRKEVTWTGYRCRSCSGSGSRPGNIPFTECAFCHSPNIEKNDSDSNKKLWKLVSDGKCELEEPYQCPWCSGHLMLDATFLGRVGLEVKCPYCGWTAWRLNNERYTRRKDNITMDIRELSQTKDKLGEGIEKINDTISSRWERLIGFGCGYFADWSIVGDIVNVNYVNRCGDIYIDRIPIKFFEGDEKEAVITYQKYIDDIKKEEKSRKEEGERKRELEILRKLTEKYPKVKKH